MIWLTGWLAKSVTEFEDYRQIPPGELQLHLPNDTLSANCDASQLHQALENLLENAWHYARPGDLPLLTVSLSRQGEEALVSVMDTGPGVSEAAIKQMFEPFFSERREGTGLGLYLARELCEANGARLSYVSQPTGGRFDIRLPLIEEVAQP